MKDQNKQGQWIPIEEGLPESWVTVLVYTQHDTMDMIWYSAINGWQRNVPVTHWMPLPEPPDMKGE